MNTNKKTAPTRKVIIALLLFLAMFFSTFTAGIVPAARAQEASTLTPTLSATPTLQQNPTLQGRHIPSGAIPSQRVIQFTPGTSDVEKKAYIASLGATVIKRIEPLNTYVVRISKKPSTQLIPDSKTVADMEQDYYVSALDDVIPNDPRYAEQWALPAIGAPSAWAELPADAPKVIVAVIDSGICASHPDLSGRILDGWDFLESDAVPQDDFGHGCSVAGVIAANMNDGVGIAGVAPNAQIMPLRVLNASGVGSYSDVAAAIVYAADNGAQVINLSLGGSNPSSTLENAVNYAISKGVIVVAAAGNNGTEGALYPAAYLDVIAVGSVDPNLQHSSFSNYGSQIDIWAPGRDILTTKGDGGFGLVSGTSFAAPYVAGAEALEIILGQYQPLDGTTLSLANTISQLTTPTVEITIIPTSTSSSNTTGGDEKSIYTNNGENYQLQYPADWHLYPDVYEGRYTEHQTTLISNFEINLVNPEGQLIIPQNGTAILINFEGVLPYNESLSDYVDSYIKSPEFTSVDEVTIGSYVALRLVGDTGEIIVISLYQNIYSFFLYKDNNPLNLDQVNQLISSFATINHNTVPISPNNAALPGSVGEPYLPSTGSIDGLSSAGFPALRMPWDKSSTYRLTGGPHNASSLSSCTQVTLSGATGLDLGLNNNEVLAAADGKLQDKGYQTGSIGNYVIIDHGNGWSTRYWHLSAIDSTILNMANGTSVPQGKLLGISGACPGCGPHLHLEIKYNNSTSGITWHGQSIDGYVVRAMTLQSDATKILNYQGTLTKGNESTQNINYSFCSNTPITKWIGSSVTVEAGSSIGLISTNSKSTGGGGTPSLCSGYEQNNNYYNGVVFYPDFECREDSRSALKFNSVGFRNLTDYSFNDLTKSIYVKSNWSVRIWEHNDRGGASRCMDHTFYDLKKDWYDNGPQIVDNNNNATITSIEVFNNSTCTSAPQGPGTPSLQNPSNGANVPNPQSITFNWTATGDNYDLILTGGPSAATYGINTNSYTFGQSLWAGVYQWRVRAYRNGQNADSATWTLNVRPGTPSSISVTTNSTSAITVNWGDSAGGVDGFKVYRNGNLIQTVGGGTHSYQVTGLSCGDTSTYSVRGYKGSLDSDAASTNGSTSACPVGPDTPSLISPSDNASVPNPQSVTFDWSDAGSTYTFELTGGTSATTQTGLTSSQTSFNSLWAGAYQWRVTAYRNGYSATSGWRTLNVPPGVPGSVNVTTNSTSAVTVNWTSSPGGVDGYRIYRNNTLVFTAGSSSTTYQVTGLPCGDTSSYSVKGYKGSLESTAGSANGSTSACPVGPDTPSLISPSDSASVPNPQSVTFDWSDAGSTYTFELTGGPSGTTQTGLATSQTSFGSLWAGIYQWRVTAYLNGYSATSGWRTLNVPPGVPGSVSVTTDSTSAVTVNWTASPGGVDGYRIYRNNALVFTAGSSSTNYQVTGLLCGDTSSYSVKGYKGSLESVAGSANGSTSACPTGPTIPSLLNPPDNASIPNPQSVTFDWSDAGNTYTFELTGGPSATTQTGLATSQTSFGSLWSGIYQWRVTAYRNNLSATSGWRTLNVPPSVPGSVSVTTNSISAVTVNWASSSGGVDGYKLYRNGSLIATVGSGTNNYQVTGLSCGDTSSYSVKGYSGSLDSTAGSTTGSTTACTVGPNTPTLISPTNGTSIPNPQSVIFDWSASGDSYAIEITGGPSAVNTSVTPDSLNFGSMWPGVYQWHVKAYKNGQWSDWSNTWTFSVPPGAPGSVSVTTNSSSAVTVNWTSSPGGVDGYKVYRNGSLVTTVNGSTFSYQVTGLSCEDISTYSVVGYKGTLDSVAKSASGTTAACVRTVQVLDTFTTDENGTAASLGIDPISVSGDAQAEAIKTDFNAGDAIQLFLTVENQYSSNQTAYFEWIVLDPAGYHVPALEWNGNLSTASGIVSWLLPTTIPTDALTGDYSFTGAVTFNGNRTTHSFTFHVTGVTTVKVVRVYTTDDLGVTAFNKMPQAGTKNDVSSNSVKTTFNAGDPIFLYIDYYNNVSDGELATYDWSVIDPLGRLIQSMAYNGDLTNYLGDGWWRNEVAIPSNAITGTYTYTGSITYNEQTTSATTTFYVNGLAGPTNNSFGTPITINNIPYSNSQDTWGATTASTDPIPNCGSGKNSNSVWYKYIAPGNGLLEVDTWGSDYDTVLSIWTGSVNNLTSVQCNDDAYGYLQAWLQEIHVNAGTTYYIEVMDYGNPGGGNLELYVNFASTPPNDDFNTPTTISTMPYSKSQDVRGATKASDDPSLSACNRLPGKNSVWYKYTTSTLAGQLELDTIGSDYDTMLAVWTGTRGNLTPLGCNDDIGTVNEEWDSDSILSVQLQPGTTYYIEVSQFNGYIDINSATATGQLDKPKPIIELGELSGLEEKKSAIDNGEATLTTAQDARGGDIGAQLWGGQLQLHANFRPVPTAPTLVSPTNGTTLPRTNNTLLDWNTTGTTCTVHVWGGSIDISPTGGCADLVLGEQRGGAYSWQVTAENAYGSVTGPVWSFNIKPHAPSNLQGFAVSATQVDLTWTLSNDEPADIDGYDIYKSGTLIGSVGKGVNQYSVTSGISCNTSYTYLVRARRQNVQSVNSNSISITAPCAPTAFNKSSPAKGATNQPASLTLSWGTSTGATSYDYCYDTTNDNSCATWTGNGTSTNKTLSGLNADTVYYWHVRAVNSGGTTYANASSTAFWSFTTKSNPPGAFNKSSPANGVTNQPANLTLSWDASPGATSYEYCYDTTNDNICTTWVGNGASTTKVLNGLSHNTTYYWQVRAKNPGGITYSNDSRTAFWSFTIGKLPSAPVLISPPDNTVTHNATPTFTWNSSNNGVTYEIQIDDSTTFTAPIVQTYIGAVGELTYTATTLPSKALYWRVRAYNINNEPGTWSAYRKLVIDTKPPSPPTLSSPANNASVRGTPTYSWLAPSTAVKYQFEYDNDGDFSSPVYTSGELTTLSHKPPAQAFNTLFYWHVRARDTAGNWSGWSASRSITILPKIPATPVLTSPADGSVTNNVTPTLTWNAVAFGNTYEIQIDDSTNFTAPLVQTNIGAVGELTYTATVLPSKALYWRVRAYNVNNEPGSWSAYRKLVIDTKPPSPPTLSSPANNASVRGTPTYSWLAPATAVRYQFEYDDDSDFSSPIYTSSELTTLTHKPPAQALNTLFYWHVRARDTAGNWSEWSAFRSITILPKVPVAPVLTSPADGSITNNVTPTFTWNSVTYGNTYEIQIATNATFTKNLQTLTTEVGELSIMVGPLTNGKYFWRVRAINVNDEIGAWSTYRYFTVTAP